jgi:hypothetical protein
MKVRAQLVLSLALASQRRVRLWRNAEGEAEKRPKAEIARP